MELRDVFFTSRCDHSLVQDQDALQYEGCHCDGKCADSSCDCLQRFAADQSCPAQKPLFECNSQCRCTLACPNRATQTSGFSEHLRVFLTHDQKGWGVKTAVAIPQGSFVIKYVGQVIPFEVAKQRRSLQESKGKMTFLIVVREIGKVTTRTCIDARHQGNISRFINHSCDPNLEAHCVRRDSPIPEIAFFALRDILPGEELCFCYGGDSQPAKEAAHNTGRARRCLCASAKCCLWMPFDLDDD